MNILLSVEPVVGGLFVIGIIFFILFLAVLDKFFKIAKDVHEIAETLGEIKENCSCADNKKAED